MAGRLGYIPLVLENPDVLHETKRQQVKGMPLCDCSNCKPLEAESLWLAQPTLTNANFDEALQMDEEALETLASEFLPPPLPTPGDNRPVALLCGADDEILDCPIVETLVTCMERAFALFFLERFTRPSALGPSDYFGRDLAWDVAKNFDVLRVPSDLELILVSETLEGQFDCLFGAFLQWKDENDSAPAIAAAAKRRQAVNRPKNNLAVPQSVEGSQMHKDRTAAAKLANKEARESKKKQLASEKAAAKEKQMSDKRTADAIRLEAKLAASTG
ncbi:uncharacterized protein MELLADRAFT_59725 [Melampsora larici-populina 98AG31]|uniref:Uncharacterized protein n=1 Tax=Melampsora larici-populina (strain 98AG31 / pathotype 3-4-7) TaxID=747676 RepID=F4R725_MELLP|nr:uncharacterized protein MELLADRAFT_59725 [Melampsora larici-populina 98AG31]EGG11582.1 hypothetical protein MELLADRAFT_59725 [Melampsora larici-populina 98AG31]